MKNFGNKIKNLRENEKLTQLEMAKDFKVSQNTIHKWETGKTEPDYDTLLKIAEYFNVSANYLLDFEPTEQQRSVINEVYEFAQEIGITNDTIKNMTPQRKAELQQIINILCNKTQDK